MEATQHCAEGGEAIARLYHSITFVLCSLWRLHSTVLKVVRPLPGCTIALHLCCGTHGIAKQNSKRAAVFARLLAMRSVCRLENPASHT